MDSDLDEVKVEVQTNIEKRPKIIERFGMFEIYNVADLRDAIHGFHFADRRLSQPPTPQAGC